MSAPVSLLPTLVPGMKTTQWWPTSESSIPPILLMVAEPRLNWRELRFGIVMERFLAVYVATIVLTVF